MEQPSTQNEFLKRYSSLSRRNPGIDEASRRMMFRSFQRVLGPWLPGSHDARILDAGCGEGVLLEFLKSKGYTHLDGFDISPENVDLCRGRGLSFVRLGNILNMEDLAPESFDTIFLMDIIEHVSKEKAGPMLAQLKQLLAPKGCLILQTPNMGAMTASLHRYCDLTHEFGLTEKSARDLLMLVGFADSSIEIRPAWNATTLLGRIRELYLSFLHRAFWLVEGADRPRIATRNLLIRATRD